MNLLGFTDAVDHPFCQCETLTCTQSVNTVELLASLFPSISPLSNEAVCSVIHFLTYWPINDPANSNVHRIKASITVDVLQLDCS